MSTLPVTAAPVTAVPDFSDISALLQPSVDFQIALAATVQAQVKSTAGVTAVNAYGSSFDVETSTLTVAINVQTANGPLSISTTIPVTGFGITPFGESFGL